MASWHRSLAAILKFQFFVVFGILHAHVQLEQVQSKSTFIAGKVHRWFSTVKGRKDTKKDRTNARKKTRKTERNIYKKEGKEGKKRRQKRKKRK